jgi:hypothetical protein
MANAVRSKDGANSRHALVERLLRWVLGTLLRREGARHGLKKTPVLLCMRLAVESGNENENESKTAEVTRTPPLLERKRNLRRA